MKTQTKQWFLYGTLFAALGFSISGNDNKLDGYAQLSSTQLAPKPSAEAEAKLVAAAEAKKASRTTADAAKAAEAARAAEAAKTNPPTQVEESAQTPADVVVPTSAQIAAPPVARASTNDQRTNPRGDTSAARTSAPVAATSADNDLFVDGHDYKEKLINANGQTTVIYSEKPEGSDCKDECGKSPRVEVIDGEMGSNIAAIKDKLRQQIIPKDIHRKKNAKTQTTKTAESSEDDSKATVSKGLTTLRAKIHQRCKHLTKTSSEVSCKSKEFVQLLKSDKKAAKSKKDKDGNKVARLITDEDAETYFNDEIADGLKEMLTHKFDIQPVEGLTVLEQRLRNSELYSEISREKSEARADKRDALALIKSLLRDIDGEYSDTRAAVSGLYKSALREQADEALSNLSNRNDQIRSQDYAGAQSSFASFLANFDYLRGLNTDLYGTMNDGLNFARKNGLLENDSYRDITREMNDFKAAILKEVINNPSILERGINSLDTAISNAARGMRGTGVNSGAINSGTSSLIRQVLSNGNSGSRGGGRGI